jgi:hypothetical protein
VAPRGNLIVHILIYVLIYLYKMFRVKHCTYKTADYSSAMLGSQPILVRPDYAARDLITGSSLRADNDNMTRVTPLMIMLTPTRTPIAQAVLDGHCI